MEIVIQSTADAATGIAARLIAKRLRDKPGFMTINRNGNNFNRWP